MLIKIDVREKDVLALVEARAREGDSETIERAPLVLGDCIVCDPDGTERVIIERKTLRDLAASIRDGRYDEQSCRLGACSVPNHHIVYLIEGELCSYTPGHTRVSRDALISAMVSLNFHKGFSVHRTSSVEESADWLIRLARKLGSKQQPGYFEAGGGELPRYGEVVKRAKKDCITKDNVGEIMLAQIPNVSPLVAAAVIERYGNIGVLIQALRDDRDALSEIKLVGKTGKTRALSKPARESLFRFLVGDVREPTLCSPHA